MNKQFDYSLYLITDGKPNLLARVEQALQGGVTCVQYREKTKSFAEMIAEATALKKLCHQYNVPLFINDYIELAKEIGADGVHLGQSDMPLLKAKQLLGNISIGISARNVAEAKTAEKNGADYVGVGAIFPTNSKSDAELVSMETVKEITENVNIPVLLIGGISQHNVQEITVGYEGICVISAILSAENPKKATEELKALI